MTTQGGELSEACSRSGGTDQIRHTNIFKGWPLSYLNTLRISDARGWNIVYALSEDDSGVLFHAQLCN